VRKLAAFAALLLLAGTVARAAGDSGLLPPDGFLGRWSRHEGTRVFPGAELYGHIDGGAELFLEFGFDTLTLQRYHLGSDEFIVEIYGMADPEAALGIYLMKCGRETPDAGFAERHTVGRYQLEFVRGRYYGRVTSVEGKTELQPALLDFGRFAAARMPAASAPAGPGLLPREGLVEGTLRLIRGPYALQAVAGSLGEGDFLLLDGKVTAAAGDYREPGDAVSTRVVAEYPSGEVASASFRGLRERLDPLLKVLEAEEKRVVFRDGAGKFGVVSLDGRRVEVRFELLSKPAFPGKKPGPRQPS
jgi:hypothetical protein